MSNTELITKFYKGFSSKEVAVMLSCYDDAIVFKDPAFGELKGEDAKNMWRMLLSRKENNLVVKLISVKEIENGAIASWEATYLYGPQKRAVKNCISAEFIIENGKIQQHIDHFNLWKWSSQALGLIGVLLGWTPFMKNKIQGKTKHLLQKFKEKRA